MKQIPIAAAKLLGSTPRHTTGILPLKFIQIQPRARPAGLDPGPDPHPVFQLICSLEPLKFTGAVWSLTLAMNAFPRQPVGSSLKFGHYF